MLLMALTCVGLKVDLQAVTSKPPKKSWRERETETESWEERETPWRQVRLKHEVKVSQKLELKLKPKSWQKQLPTSLNHWLTSSVLNRTFGRGFSCRGRGRCRRDSYLSLSLSVYYSTLFSQSY